MHNKHIKSNHRKIPPILLGISGVFLFSFLISTSNYTYAEPLIIDPDERRSLKDISTMQQMSQQICINSRDEETNTLRDTRDDKIYYVTKLKDGNCWMTQNLAYNGTGDQSCTVNGDTCSSWPSSGLNPIFYAIGSHTNSNHNSQGNFYTWQAAQEVCPAGWKLPLSNSQNQDSFYYLLKQYGVQNSISGTDEQGKSHTITDEPLYSVRSGYIFSSKLHMVAVGYYWSSVPSDSSTAFTLSFSGSNVYPSVSGARNQGFSVRCLAEGGWLDSYPDPEPPISDDSQANVSITVSPVISIDVTQHVDTEVDFTHVAKSNIIARVGSNQPYQVLFSTDQSNLEQSPILTNQNIPMITSDQTITAGTSNWGIKKLSSPTDTTTTPDTIYSPVGIGDNKALFYTSNTAASEDLTFPVAIAVSPQLPSGKYSTQATLTAVAM